MSTNIPEFRDVWTLYDSTYWLDRRGGISALINDRVDGVSRDELQKIFKSARRRGLEISPKLPLLVYGVVSCLGETDTFKFIQMTPRQLDDLDEAIYQATSSTIERKPSCYLCANPHRVSGVG